MKTSELEGQALNDAVALSLGWTRYPTDSVEMGMVWHMEPDKTPFGLLYDRDAWNPSTDWAQGGPLIEQEDISFRKYHRPDSAAHGTYYARVCRESGTMVHWKGWGGKGSDRPHRTHRRHALPGGKQARR